MICTESSNGGGAGLGNQLFRYAFVRALQLDTGETIRIYDYHRGNEAASHAKMILPEIVPEDIDIQYMDCKRSGMTDYFREVLPIRYCVYLVIQKIWRCTHGMTGPLTKEQKYKLCCAMQPIMNRMGVYFDADGEYVPYRRYGFPPKFHCIGYFFSRSFFAAHEEQIREELHRPELITEKNHSLREKIQSCNSVAVHMRYGDFVDNKNYQFLYVCDEHYYEAALARAAHDLTDPVFFIFTNDQARAASTHFPQGSSVVYIGSGNSAIEDLQLMAQCKHFIIPNSTFSWWGQFLSKNQAKKVYAPNRWYRYDDPADPSSLIEKNWTIIDSELPPL